MKMQRIVVLLLVLALVIGLEMVLMTKCSSDGSAPAATIAPSPSAEPTVDATAAPTAPQQPINTAPVGYTSPPAPAAPNTNNNNNNNNTSTATQAPAPTQAPTPTAAPTQPSTAGTVTASNSFSSNTGTGVNMGISWTATDMGNGTTRLTINGTVSSWSLQVMSQPISISFSGYTKSLMGNSIDVGDSANMSTNALFSTTMDVATGTSGTMNVVWSYNGTYGHGDSEVSLPTITASDFVYTN